jgi:predicted phage-related endonuclease
MASVDLSKTISLDDLAEEIATLRKIKSDLKKLESQKKDLESKIKIAMGDAEVGEINGVISVTWQTTYPVRLSQTLLKNNYPDVFEACQDISIVRTFLLK